MAEPTITTPEEALAFLQEKNIPPTPMAVGAARFIPETQRALSAFTGPSRVDRLIQEETRPGVPLKVNPSEGELSTVSPWVRFQTERRQNLADQQAYLETQFPGKVRKAKGSDDFIIEMTDPDTGQPRDVLLNEEQITLGDMGALAAHAPEIAFSIAAMAGAGPLGGALSKGPAIAKALGWAVKSNAGRLAAGAAGFKIGEAAQQIETEIEQGQKPNVGQILDEKGREIPGQAVLDTATYGVFKAASLAKRVTKGGPGMFQTTVQKEGLQAQKELAKSYPGAPKLTYSAGEASGMPVTIFLEAYAEAKPQATAIVKKFKDAQVSEIQAISKAMTARTGTDEEVGKELLDFLAKNQKVKQDALDSIRQTMTAQEQAALTKQLGSVATVTSPFYPAMAGGAFRGEVQTAFQSVKGRVQNAYQAAYSVPGAKDPVVPTAAIVKEIDDVLAKFPTASDIQWLKDYKAGINPNEAYRDVVQRRSDLWDKIETAPVNRETKDYVFGRVSKAMTQTLDDAAKNIMDPAFRGQIQKANGIFKNVQLPFYQTGIGDILLKAGERGAPENVALLNRFSQSTDLYRRLVDTLGPTSPAVGIVKTSVMDGLLTKSGTSAIDPKFIDAAKFVQNLDDLASNPKTRELFQDIFGSRGKSLLEQAKVMRGIQGTLNKEEAEALLTSGAPTLSKGRLRRVLDAQKQLDTVEARRLLDGPIDNIQPEEFVNRFMDRLTESELDTLAKTIRTQSPPLYAKIQDKLTEQILGKAGTYETWSRSSIEKVLNDAKRRPKYQSLLGPDKFKDIENFAKALGPIQYAQEVAEGTGMLVKGQSIGALARIFKYEPGKGRSKTGEIMREIPPWLGWKAAARFLHSDWFRTYSSKGFPPATTDFVPAALITEPLLEEIAGSSQSPAVVRNLVLGVRNWNQRAFSRQQQAQAPTQQITTPEEAKAFLNAQ